MSKKDNNNIVENEQTVKAAAEEAAQAVDTAVKKADEEHLALDDARRVKVLSPSMLVFKRFIRNKLAITGSIILIFMFLFSFVGGMISPYTESQIFNTTDVRSKEYARGSETKTLSFDSADPNSSLGTDNAEVLNAIKSKKTYSDGKLSVGGTIYKIDFVSEDFTDVYKMEEVATASVLMGEASVNLSAGAEKVGITDADKAALAALIDQVGIAEGIEMYGGAKNSLVQFKDLELLGVKASKQDYKFYAPVLVAMSSRSYYDPKDPNDRSLIESFDFKHGVEMALANEETSFEIDGVEYTVETQNEPVVIPEIIDANDPAYDPDFQNTIKNNGMLEQLRTVLTESEDTSDKVITVDGRQYTLKWVEYEVKSQTGKAINEEIEAIVSQEGFQQAAYDCYITNADTAMVRQTGNVYKIYEFNFDGATYTLQYNEDQDYFVLRPKDKPTINFAKLQIIKAYDLVFTNDAGEEEVFAEASLWSASSIKKAGEEVAYVSNFKVMADPTRPGLKLDLDFINKVRMLCVAMPTDAQSGQKFTHDVWIKESIEPKTMNGNLVSADESNYEEFSPDRFGVIEIAADGGYRYFALLDNNGEGKTVELTVKEKRAVTKEKDDIGEYYIPVDDENGRLYTKWPALASDNDGMFYTDQSGAKIYVASEAAMKPVIEIEPGEGEEGDVEYYVGEDGTKYALAEYKDTLDTENNTITVEGEVINLKTEPDFTAVEGSDDQGKFYTVKDSEEKVYVVELTAEATDDGYTVTDAYGNTTAVRFTITPELDKGSDENGSFYTAVDGSKVYDSEIGVQTEAVEGGDDKMFVWVTGDDPTVDNLKAKKVYIQTTKVQNIADEGEEGAELRNMEFVVEKHPSDYTVMTNTEVEIFDANGAPSRAHWLGTDNHGMDTLTRIMYGGRISLLVGFVVIFIEMLIGVIFGGISGYFGGIVDTIMMRFVDLFNCIPYWPMMLIGGSLMDAYNVRGSIRIFVLVGIMGVLGWTGTARIVRGQILSLREQDFMVATEAGGIRVSRRIFKHLVPNVMPLLIVQATMGLGSIIISEATLSFLGLGVQFPQASWGSIINSIQTAYEMTNYWYVWVPTGLCIMLAVLGFNFVGDGLRDAFDPKMKR